MALMGVVKFLPLLLFYVLVSGLTDEREKMIASLPMLGCLMTAFSFVMMQFEVFEQLGIGCRQVVGIFSISEYICIVYANLSDSCNVEI